MLVNNKKSLVNKSGSFLYLNGKIFSLQVYTKQRKKVYMNIAVSNNSQTKPNFQGYVDKSVTKYLDKSLKIYKKNVVNSRSQNITDKINSYEELITNTKIALSKFVERCHPNTKLKLKDVKFPVLAKDFVIENSSLPTNPNINVSRRISIRFFNINRPLDTDTLKAVKNSFEHELSPTNIDRNLLRYAINNLEAKAHTNWFNKIIANWQLKKAEKFSIEINKGK